MKKNTFAIESSNSKMAKNEISKEEIKFVKGGDGIDIGIIDVIIY